MRRNFNSRRNNPEPVLRRAKEFAELQETDDAWRTLSVFLGSRKRNWQNAHEELMLFFVDLSVQLRKSTKDGFIQFRHLCQTTHSKSLEKCLVKLLQRSQECLDEEFQSLVDEYKDQDYENDPAINKEFEKRKFDLPYLKYQWNVYRTVLDVLRNNQKLDDLYHRTVKGAIHDFCLKYSSKNEYRKLCGTVRKHLLWIYEHTTQQNSVDIQNSPQTLGNYLNTLSELLENATKLQLWQEAFRLSSDIHTLKERSKAPLSPTLERNYYRKLAQMFLESNDPESRNILLHAYAQLKYYALACGAHNQPEERGRKEREVQLDEDDIRKLGLACVMATLAVQPPRSRSQTLGPATTTTEDKFQSMAQKLDFYAHPNRTNLLEELDKEDLLDVDENFKALRNLMIEECSPLDFCDKVTKVIQAIINSFPELEVYVKFLKRAAAKKLIMSVSKMYTTIYFDHLRSMFFDEWSQNDIEKLVINLSQRNLIWCRICHRKEMCFFRPPKAQLDRNSGVKTYLAQLSTNLNLLLDKGVKHEQIIRKELFQKLTDNAANDEVELQKKLVNIHKRRVKDNHKNKLQRFLQKTKTREEKDQQEQARKIAEEKREKDREKKRLQAEQDIIKKKSQRKREDELSHTLRVLKRVDIGQKHLKKMKDLIESGKLAPNQDVSIKIEENVLAAAKEELQKKLAKELKETDYMIRACRREEIPLIKEHNKQNASSNKDEDEYKKEVKKLEQEFKQKKAARDLFMRAKRYTGFFQARVDKRREEIFNFDLACQQQRKEAYEAKQKAQKTNMAAQKARQAEEVKTRKARADALQKTKRPVVSFADEKKEEVAEPEPKVERKLLRREAEKPPANDPTPKDPRRPIGTAMGSRTRPTDVGSRPAPRGDIRRPTDGAPRRAHDAPPPERVLDRSKMGASRPTSGPRRRFVNSSKPAGTSAGGPRKFFPPEESDKTPANRSSPRGDEPIRSVRPAGNVRPTGGRRRFVNSRKAATDNVRPATNPTTNVRPTGNVRPSSSNVRPPANTGNVRPQRGRFRNSNRPTITVSPDESSNVRPAAGLQQPRQSPRHQPATRLRKFGGSSRGGDASGGDDFSLRRPSGSGSRFRNSNRDRFSSSGSGSGDRSDRFSRNDGSERRDGSDNVRPTGNRSVRPGNRFSRGGDRDNDNAPSDNVRPRRFTNSSRFRQTSQS